jgi:hypothetical protein
VSCSSAFYSLQYLHVPFAFRPFDDNNDRMPKKVMLSSILSFFLSDCSNYTSFCVFTLFYCFCRTWSSQLSSTYTHRECQLRWNWMLGLNWWYADWQGVCYRSFVFADGAYFDWTCDYAFVIIFFYCRSHGRISNRAIEGKLSS